MIRRMADNSDGSQKARKGERIVICAEVLLRRAGQNNYRVNAYDISRHGCRVEFVERPDAEECVWVKFDGIEPIEASVRWTRGFAAGLLFQHAIHPAVFAMLIDRLVK